MQGSGGAGGGGVEQTLCMVEISRTFQSAVSTHGPASASASSLGLRALWCAGKAIHEYAGPRSPKLCAHQFAVYCSFLFFFFINWFGGVLI